MLLRLEVLEEPPGALPFLRVGPQISPVMSRHFPFQGYEESIPPFLRFEGVVENKKPTKKDVINLLKDAWKERLAEEQVRSQQPFWPGVASRILREVPSMC